MTLRTFIERAALPTCTLAVLNGDIDGPLEQMLAETFDGQIPVTELAERDLEKLGLEEMPAEDIVVLLEDAVPVAASPMSELYNSLLAINSDLFITGARELGEIGFPDVLANLDAYKFTLRGYPLAHKEKLLLILISRYIEQLAWTAGTGTLRTAVQQISRLTDEVGTREVYTELSATAVDVHIYGVDDGSERPSGLTYHTGTEHEYRDSWFVVFRPASQPTDVESGALVCLETEPRVWDGYFTFDDAEVTAIDEYIATAL